MNFENLNFIENYMINKEKLQVKEKECPKIEEDVRLRLDRNLETAKIIENLAIDKVINESDKEELISLQERRDWSKMLNSLENDDVVITVLTPTARCLSIKNLNDVVFGPQLTDSIIAKRRELSQKYFFENLIDKNVNIKPDNLDLEQNYKYGVFKLPGEIVETIGSVSEFMNNVCTQVDQEMTKYVLEEASKLPQEPKIIDFIKEFTAHGFRLSYGISEVKDNQTVQDSLSNKFLTLAQSFQSARLAGLKHGLAHEKFGYGQEYSESDIESELIEFDRLHQNLSGEIITNASGIQFEIIQDGVFNRDVLRDIRKGKFEISEGDDKSQALLEQAQAYIKILNLLDFVKPCTNDELIDNSFDKKLKKHQELAIDLVNNSNFDQARLKTELEYNEKDRNFTSEAIFHKRALEIERAAYLSLDVLDVGVDQLLEYEQLLKKVNKKDDGLTFAQASLMAGDSMTKQLREIRQKVFNVLETHDLVKDGELATGLVGGDELTLVVDLDKLGSDDKMNRLMFDLKRATNIRLIKTVVSKSDRLENEQVNREDQHLLSLKRAELGATQAKEIEAILRKVRLKHGREKIDQLIRTEGFDSLVVIEDTAIADGFKFRIENDQKLLIELTKDNLLDKLRVLIGETVY
ncbi:MAG: hypothetical protein PHS07_03295 [Patescibacteria group bacterium]|nr:hypothetical protein [Patescibacteria group bacterium]